MKTIKRKKRSITSLLKKLLIFLVFVSPTLLLSQQIITMEYFIDTDPGIGNGIPVSITSGDSVFIFDSVNTAGLTPGIHYLNIRFKDSVGVWCHSKTKLFYVLDPSTIWENEQEISYPLISAEYFIDNDPGIGNAIPVTMNGPVENVNILDSVNTAGLTPGIHYLNIRFKDSVGVWSHSKTELFYVLDPSTIWENELEISYPLISAEYFIDDDPGIGNAIPVTMSGPVDNINILDSVNTNDLAHGIHYLNIRFKDSVGVWCHSKTKLFYVLDPSTIWENEQEISYPLISAEYFIDDDPGIGNAIPVTMSGPVDNINILDSVNTKDLAPGIHYLNIRFKDSVGVWSHSKAELFYVLDPSTIWENEQEVSYPLISAEYFIDDDPGIGNAIPVTMSGPVENVNLFDSVNTAGLAPGIHYLNIRFKDSVGVWCHSKTELFYVLDPSTIWENELEISYPLISAEYFIDDDPGIGNAIPVTMSGPVDNINILDSVNTNDLAPGIHYLNIRFKDSVGVWSHSKAELFYVLDPSTIWENEQEVSYPLISAEYFIDDDPGIGNAIPVTMSGPVENVNLFDSVNTAGLAPGIHYLNIRFKDSVGVWCHCRSQKFKYLDSALYVLDSIGLVAWYPFNGNAFDESGNGNNGIVEGASLCTDRFGNNNCAYSFNGTSNFISIGAFESYEELTISAWTYVYGSTNWFQAIVSSNTGNSANGFVHLQMNGNGFVCIYVDGNSWFSLDYLPDEPYNTWQFITLVVKSGESKLYVNNSVFKESDCNYSLISQGDNVFIGKGADDIRFFNGIIDDVRIYNRALSEEEITTLYNEAAPILLTAPTLISPTNNSINQNINPVFQWDSVNNATSYTLQVALNNEFNEPIINESGITETNYEVFGLECNTQYYWRTRATNDTLTSNWSEVWSFITCELPTATISGTTSICIGETTELSVALTGTSPYSIEFSDGFVANNVTASPYIRNVSPEANTEYSIIDITDVNCSNTGYGIATITVNTLPTATISGTTSICIGETTELSVALTGTSPYSIEFSDGFVANIITASPYIRNVSPEITTEYSITNVSDIYCSNTGTGLATITVNTLPTATISGTTSICIGENVELSVALTGTSPFSIEFSDGFTANNVIVSPYIRNVSPEANTEYSIVEVTDVNCSNTGTGIATITVNTLPTATISGTTSICIGETTELSVALTGTSPYSIEFSDGFVANNVTASPYIRNVSPEANTEYSIIEVTDVNCSNNGTGLATVTVNTLPTATISGTTSICIGESADLSVALTGTSPYSIEFSDGFVANNVTASPYIRNVSPEANTEYSIIDITDANCSNTGTGLATITVNSLPTATISGTTSICIGEMTELSVALTGTSPYLIEFSDGFVANNITASPYIRNVSPEANTEYSIIEVTDVNCSNTGTGIATITFNTLPTATISGTTSICIGESAELSVALTGTSPFSIEFSDGFIVNNITVSPYIRNVNPEVTTEYSITNVTDVNCSNTGTGIATITVHQLPTATISGTTSICIGETTELSVALTGTSPFSIEFSDGFVANNITASPYIRNVSPEANTEYSIIEVTDANCSNTGTGIATITVNTLPTATISGTTSICIGENVELSVALTGTSPFSIEFSDGFTANNVIETPYIKNVSPEANIEYSIIEVTDANCSNAGNGIATITVNTLPTATISGTTSICIGETTELSVALTGTSPFSIEFSDGFVANNITASPYIRNVSPEANIDYSIIEVTDVNCSNIGTGIATITVNTLPTAIISGTTSICIGENAELSVALTGTSPFSIEFSDGFIANNITASPYIRNVSPEVTTEYSITNVTDLNCSNTGTGLATITVHQLPTATISGTTSICIGENAELSVALTGTSPFSIEFSDGFIVNNITVSPYVRNVSPEVNTEYSIVEVTDANCSNTGTGIATITVNTLPTATISGTTSICIGENVELSVALTGTSPFSIEFSDGFVANNVTASPYIRNVNPEVTTEYSITNVTDLNCSNTGTGIATITVNTLPTATISGTTSICIGENVELSVALTGTSPFSIEFSDGFIVNNITVSPYVRNVSPEVNTEYSIVEVTDANCSNTGTGIATITVNTLPTATISGTTSICIGENVELSVALTGTSPFSIEFSDGFVANNVTASPYIRNVSPEANTEYSIVEVTDVNCSNTGTGIATITVNTLPTATISGTTSICIGETTELSVALTGTSPFSIEFSDGIVANNVTASPYIRNVNPEVTTEYSITNVTDLNCSNTGTGIATITVNTLPTATISGTTSICIGENVELSVALTGTSPFSIEFSDGFVANNVTASPYIRNVNPEVTTEYSITNVTDANCSNTGTGIATITVNTLPTATISGTTSICIGETTELSVALTGTSPYSIEFSDGFVANNVTASPYIRNVSPEANTEYSIIDITDVNCSNTGTGLATITVNTLPTATISGTTSICVGDSTDLTAALTGTPPWSVTFIDNFIQENILESPFIRNVSPFSTYKYEVTNVSDANLCNNEGNGTAKVTVHQLPTATISGTNSICNGESTDLSVALTGTSPYSIEFSDGFVANNVTVSPYIRNVSPEITTEYSISNITDANCSNAGTGLATITVNTLPTAIISGTTPICIGETTELSVALTGTSPHSIEFSDGFTANNVSVSPYIRNVSPDETTEYSITNVTDANCSNAGTGIATITVNTLPTATISGTTSICIGETTELSVALTGTSPYSIEFSDGFVANNVTASPYIRNVSPEANIDYSIIEVTDANCSNAGTGLATITVNTLPTATISGTTSICIGETTELSVALTGTSPFSIEFSDGIVANNVTASPYIRNVSPEITTEYSITNVSDANCSNAGTGLAIITVYQLPTAFNITGGGSYIEGGIGVEVGLDGSEIGVEYSLFVNGIATGIIQNGTGAALNFGYQTIEGNYTAIGTLTGSNCNSNMLGITEVTIINAFTQEIQLTSGWNTISSNIFPIAPNMEDIFAEMENLVIVKNADGQVYNPAQNINQIGDWNIAHGYMVYVTVPATLQITGTEVNPTETEINLVTGWNLISYLRNSSMPVETALVGINNSLILVKNNIGQLYYPSYYLNTLGNMQVGQGYWIYMNAPAVLTYPGN